MCVCVCVCVCRSRNMVSIQSNDKFYFLCYHEALCIKYHNGVEKEFYVISNFIINIPYLLNTE